ncbi:MAG: PAS domain S-box protein [Nitrospirota bacterium]
MRILIIEDNPGDARLIQELLREATGDFKTNVAEKLGTGLKFLASQDVDAILLDLGLPDSSGLETLTGLQTHFPNLPIVIMTGFGDESLGVQAVRLGAQDYLIKGKINSELLRRTLLYAVERKKVEEALRITMDELEDRVLKRTAELHKSEQKYRNFVDNAVVGVYQTTVEGEFLYLNKSLLKLFEFESPEELIAQGALARWKNPEDRKRLIERLKKEGRVVDFEAEFLSKTGKTINATLNAVFEGDVLSGMVIDITERKQAEKALRELKESLEQQVAEHTAELQAANAVLRDSRRAALNLTEDAIAARRQAEEVNAELQIEVAERKRTEEDLRKSKKQFKLLSETAAGLLATDKPQKIVNELCQKVMHHLDCHAFFNFLVDEEKGRLHLNAYAGIPEETAKDIEWLDYGVAVCGTVARDGKRMVCNNIQEKQNPLTDLVRSFGIKAYACHPLIMLGKVIGTLSFGSRSRTSFTDDELDLMNNITDQVVIAMQRIMFLEEIKEHADELEIKVQERTLELQKTVDILHDEIKNRIRAQKTIKEQSEILDSIFKNTITPLVLLDKDFNFIRVNEAYAKVGAKDIAEFYGHNHFEYYPHEENELIFRRVVESKVPYQAIAKAFVYPDHPEWGVTYWDWTLTPLLDEYGKVKFLLLALNDVTERKRAEEAVQAERQRLYDVMEMLPAYVVLLTTDYHVPFANFFFRKRFGESHGKRCFEYLFGRTEPCEICETYSVLKTMSPHEWEWTGPDGRNYYIFDYPFKDRDGSTLILEMGIDITERKKAVEKLEQSERKYRTLIEQAADGIAILDKWLNIIDVNPAICQMSGFSRENLLGVNVKDLIPSEDLIARPLQIENLFAGETVREERKVFCKDGSLINVEATVRLLDDGKIQVIARDITERKEREYRDRLIASFLELFVKKESRKEYLDSVVQLIHEWSDCRCVGIRVVDRHGFIPYESYTGFSLEFYRLENMLSLDKDVCACVRTITGKFEHQDKSVLTPNGSFCINNSLEFADRLKQEELARFRGNCIRSGFLSIALVPLRYRGRTIGLIHLADEREGMLHLKVIEFLETISALIGEAIFRFNTEEELRNSREQLRELFAHLQSVREQERTQIAREIHDEFGAVLTGLKVDLASLEKKMPAEREVAQERLRSDLELVNSAIQIVKKISSELRPSVLDHLGLSAAIEWQVKEFGNRSGIGWDISIDIKDAGMDRDLSTAVFRIFQEALMNIIRHAEATKIHVNLKERDGFLILDVIDNGKGIPEEKLMDPHSFGLMGMRERVQYLGGDLEIKGIMNKGTTVTVKIPVKDKEAV